MTPFPDWPWPLLAADRGRRLRPLAGLVGSQFVALYLLIAGRFGVNINELYAGQGIDDVKSFLRLHIAADGALTVYPVAVDRICREWRPNPTAPDDRPWLEPAQSLVYRAADEPFVLR